jgi:fimbrial chaperone protein
MNPSSPSPLCRLALCAFAAWASVAHAGSFQVSPVRIDLGGTTLTAAVTIRNDGADPVVIQSSILAWSQSDGRDDYAPTSDALATPPIATIPAGGEQIVRVGLRRGPERATELAYRLYVQEVPQPARATGTSLQVALRVGIPVFVAAAEPKAGKLDWKATLADDGQLRLVVANRSNAHLRIAGMTLAAPDTKQELVRENGLAYVLAGQTRAWVLKLPEPAPALRAVNLHLFSDAGESDETVSVAR